MLTTMKPEYSSTLRDISGVSVIDLIINNNNNFIYIVLKSNNCPKRYLITK